MSAAQAGPTIVPMPAAAARAPRHEGDAVQFCCSARQSTLLALRVCSAIHDSCCAQKAFAAHKLRLASEGPALSVSPSEAQPAFELQFAA